MKLNKPEFLLCIFETDWLFVGMVISLLFFLFLLLGWHSRGLLKQLGYKYKVGFEAHREWRTADKAAQSCRLCRALLHHQPGHVGFGLIGCGLYAEQALMI